MVWVGEDFKAHPPPHPCHGKGHQRCSKLRPTRPSTLPGMEVLLLIKTPVLQLIPKTFMPISSAAELQDRPELQHRPENTTEDWAQRDQHPAVPALFPRTPAVTLSTSVSSWHAERKHGNAMGCLSFTEGQPIALGRWRWLGRAPLLPIQAPWAQVSLLQVLIAKHWETHSQSPRGVGGKIPHTAPDPHFSCVS